MEEEFKKIEIYSTYNLEEDAKSLEEARKTIDKLLTLNEVEHKITLEDEIVENEDPLRSKHILYVAVTAEMFDDVIELFDEYGYLDYRIDSSDSDESDNTDTDLNEVFNEESTRIADENQTAAIPGVIEFIICMAIVSGFIVGVSYLAIYAIDYINKTNANFYVVFEVVGLIILALGALGAWIMYKVYKKKGK